MSDEEVKKAIHEAYANYKDDNKAQWLNKAKCIFCKQLLPKEQKEGACDKCVQLGKVNYRYRKY